MKKTKAKSIVFLIITLLVALYIFFEAPNLNPLYLGRCRFLGDFDHHLCRCRGADENW